MRRGLIPIAPLSHMTLWVILNDDDDDDDKRLIF